MFDKIKDVTDRDIFGQGYIYRIVSKDEIADVEKITDEEKLNGIEGEKTFVPYDKGDKEGNRWYLETPYYIDWSRINVKMLQSSDKARWQGYQYYFREGFCWINVLNPNSEYIKTRLKKAGVYDVASMSLFSIFENTDDKYLVLLINSYLLFLIKHDFINNTVNVQINDIRKLPVIIPNKEQLNYVDNIVDRAIEIKKKQFNGEIPQVEAEKMLNEIQEEVDLFVYKLYGINPDLR